MTGTADLDAVVLAGGRSTRLGRDKATSMLDGDRLVDRAIAAVRGVASACVVVGPLSLDVPVPVVRERPAFGGPVAGLAAGLSHLDQDPLSRDEDILVLACDLVDPRATVAALVASWRTAVSTAVDGVHLVDPDGRGQWLTAIYRRRALVAALAALGDPAGRAMRELVGTLTLAAAGAPGSATADIDTWEDLSSARRRSEVEGDNSA